MRSFSKERWHHRGRVRSSVARWIARLATVLPLWFCVSPATGQEVAQLPAGPRPTFHASLKVAAEAALQDQSLVLLIFGAEWCPPCKALKKDTLSSTNFLHGGGSLRVAEVDIDADESTASRFGVNAVPTLFLLTGDGKIVSRLSGYREAPALLAWIEDGRRRARAGQWEGTAPGLKLEAMLAKVAGAGLDSNDLAQLVLMLGDPDPGERAGAERLLVAQREKAVTPLIDAIAEPYLGLRIGATEVLQRLAPDAVRIDPWRAPSELAASKAALKKWWSELGRLPPARTVPASDDPAAKGSVDAALEDLRTDNPVRRTEAMSVLAAHGASALPAIREAIRRHERTDPRVVALLEDVRWSILVPETLERKNGGVRSLLARGSSGERQAAAARLRHAGAEALDALSELAADADPLVVESAVRALAGIGGAQVIPAMAALLKAPDSNLRMTAAQALGRTKSIEATPHLLTALEDPNEVVACAALAALDEVNSKDSPFNPAPGAKSELDSATIDALKRTLSDPRWRVRAMGVEVIGKLKVTALGNDVKQRLEDPDGFVVKNALLALDGLDSRPEAPQLLEVARRLPALQADVVTLLARAVSAEAVAGVLELFEKGSAGTQVSILSALGRRERYESKPVDAEWKPVLAKGLVSPEPNVRRAAAGVLGFTAPSVAVEFVATLLADDDREIRDRAALVALGILSGRKGTAVAGDGDSETTLDLEPTAFVNSSAPAATKINAPPVAPDQLAAWHNSLARRPASELSPTTATLRFCTGGKPDDFPILLEVVSKASGADMDLLARSSGVAVLAPKLPWPAGQALLDAFAQWPTLFIEAAAEHERMSSEAALHLLDPPRFRKAIESASGDDLKQALRRLLASTSGSRRSWSLLSSDARTRRLAEGLFESTNAAWRAFSIYTRRQRPGSSDGNRSVFEQALKDPSPWVRVAAAQGLSLANVDRPVLEAQVGPLLADPELRAAAVAALALLEPELRTASGFQWQFGYFHFEDVSAGESDYTGEVMDRPPALLTNQPAYLDVARKRIREADLQMAMPFVLLLAQHGDFSGLDEILTRPVEEKTGKYSREPEGLMTAIALSGDSRYVPHLRRMMPQTQNEWELRGFLKAIQGMPGREVRQLRIEINRRLRQAGGSDTMMFP